MDAELKSQSRAARFQKFHAAHPEIFDQLKEMSLTLRRAGKHHWGMRNLWERLRYDLAVKTGSSDYQLHDHLPPFYARMLMAVVPELAGFFEIRGNSPLREAPIAPVSTCRGGELMSTASRQVPVPLVEGITDGSSV